MADRQNHCRCRVDEIVFHLHLEKKKVFHFPPRLDFYADKTVCSAGGVCMERGENCEPGLSPCDVMLSPIFRRSLVLMGVVPGPAWWTKKSTTS